MQIFTKRYGIILLIVLAISLLIIMAGQCFILVQKNKINQATLKIYAHNEKILDFTKLFVKDVLKSDGAVPLNEVLKLENAVREINSKPIYDEWQRFLNAKSPVEAQIEVKNLLEMLVDRVNY